MKVSNSALYVIFGVLLLTFLGLISFIFLVPTRPQRLSVQAAIANEPVQIRLLPESKVWPTGVGQRVSIVLDQKYFNDPSAATVELIFDPNLVMVQEIKNGNLWTKTEILSIDVQQNIGTAKVSLSQGAKGLPTGRTGIATFIFTPINRSVTTTKVTLGPASKISSPGTNQFSALKPEQITLTLTI